VSTDQLQQKFLKLQEEVKRTEPLHVLNGKSHSTYQKWGLPMKKNHPSVSAATTLEEAVVCLGFEAMSTVKILKKIEKSSELYQF